MNARILTRITLFSVLLLSLGLLAACGDDSPTGPEGGGEPVEDTHYEIGVRMSSILAQYDCETAPDNPGDFVWRLWIYRTGPRGDYQVHDTGYQEVSIHDGVTHGIVMNEMKFLVPNDPDSEFRVVAYMAEYDPDGPDFSVTNSVTHRLDRGQEQKWAPESDYEDDRYFENEDGSGSGEYEFAVWDERPGECSGAAYYHVTWNPTTPPNNAPIAGPTVAITYSELDRPGTPNLLYNTFDPDGDPLDATNISWVSGDAGGVTIDDAANSLRVEPSYYSYLESGESELVRYEYLVVDGRGGSTPHAAELTFLGHTPE